MHRSIRAFNKMERVGDTEEEDDEVEVVGIVSDLKINDDSTPCKELCRRSMLAASRGSTSFRLKDITRGVMTLTQRSSTSSSTCSSFQSLSDSDDEDSDDEDDDDDDPPQTQRTSRYGRNIKPREILDPSDTKGQSYATAAKKGAKAKADSSCWVPRKLESLGKTTSQIPGVATE